MARLAALGGSKVLPNGLGVQWPQRDKTEEEAVLKVVRSGNWWRGGDLQSQAKSVCGKFERDFTKWQGGGIGLCVPNGTIAVELALRGAGVKPGDEVVVPSASFVVSASAVLPLGAIPVFSDCDPDTYQPDAASIEAMISPRTRAIVIVHFGGYPANMDKIVKVAKKHGLPLIEDCAHAQGTQWRGKGAGTFGDFGTFSFQQSKAFTSGEGGLVIAKTQELWNHAYRYHNLGRREDAGFYDFHLPSSNFRLTDLQGALLQAQFNRFRKQILRKNANDKYLSGLLRKIGGVEPLPDDPRITRRGNYYYVFKYNAAEFGGLSRDEFLKAVQAEGVGAGRSYGRAIHKYPLFQNMKVPAKYKNAQYKKTSCPVAERIFAEELCVLSHVTLLAERNVLAKVAEAIAKVKENVGELLKAAKK